MEELYGKVPKFKFGPKCENEVIEIARAAVLPDKCNTSYDAVGVINGQVTIFKNQWMWNNNSSENPQKFSDMWIELKNVKRIDAVYEMSDGLTAFFIERKIYVFNGTTLMRVDHLQSYGFDERLKRVDAIFKWSKNNQIYVFSGVYFWK
jgi:hypothetical protein